MSSVTAPTSAGSHLTARTGGQVLIDQLFIHGVDHVFGVPGESYLAALDALHDARNAIKFVISCGQKTDPTNAPSRRLTMIVAQEPTQSLATMHRPLAAAVRVPRKQQDVALPLVVPLGMEMVDIVVQRPPQRALAEQDHLRQALFLDRPHPAFRVGIQVRAPRRQRQRFNPA